MRTSRFRSILDGVTRRTGGDPDQAQTADVARICEFINTRVREGLEFEFWPELVPCEQRFFRPAWTAAIYASGVEVYHAATDAYYISTGSAAADDVPGTAAVWEAVEDLERYVALDQAGETPIGEVLRVAQRNPRIYRTSPGLVDFTIADTGIIPEGYAGTSVWVEFRRRPPEFTTTAWVAETAYAADDLVYRGATGEPGECYKALGATTGDTPEDTAASWELVEFPYILAEFVKRGAYADALRAGGQHAKADGEEAAAYRFLAQAADAAGASQGQYDTAAVRTY